MVFPEPAAVSLAYRARVADHVGRDRTSHAVLLALSLGTGELHSTPHVSLRAGLALLYLIVGGSWLGFTAYVWLLARMPVTRVASHAYVNPLVAVALGYLVAGEELTLRMLLASSLVVASVFLMLREPAPRAA